MNSRFLEGLTVRGIDPSPWLDGIGRREVVAGGRVHVVELEDDPIEVMRMGEPFDTCLAPGSFNFFSAVSNAADINKRVLYVRDGRGVVQARCLLGLTDQGSIVTFHVYAHAHYDAFRNAVVAFVGELGEAMRASSIARGEISKLVAADWYDDGSVDLTGQLDLLQSDSPFIKSLPRLDEQQIVGALEAACGDKAVTPFAACAVVQALARRSHHKLIPPLLPLVGDPMSLDKATRVEIGAAARMSGDLELALQLFRSVLNESVSRNFEGISLYARLANELTTLGLAHVGLRVIRQSRPTWVKGWKDDYSERVLAAARALDALHRPHRALELYRLALRMGEKSAEPAVTRLESMLAAVH